MARIPMYDPVEYLVRRKYPAYPAYQAPQLLDGYHSGPSFEDRRQYLEEAKTYQDQLQDLPDDELNKRYAEEKQKEHEELETERTAQEKTAFSTHQIPAPISRTGRKQLTGRSKRP